MSGQQQQAITVPMRQLSAEQARRYFIPVLSVGKTIVIYFVIFACVLIFLLGIAIHNLLFVGAGIVVGIICIIVLVRAWKETPDDQEYDVWLKGQAAQIRQTAFRELEIERHDTNGPAVQIHSFTLLGASLANKHQEETVLCKKGRDGQYRFSVNYFTYLIPCHRYIALYTHCVNVVALTSRPYQNEDYAFQHIVKPVVLVSQKEVLIEGELCLCSIEQVGLGIANQDVVPLGACLAITPVDRHDGPTLALPGSGVEQTVMNIRKMLRRY